MARPTPASRERPPAGIALRSAAISSSAIPSASSGIGKARSWRRASSTWPLKSISRQSTERRPSWMPIE